MQCSCNDNNNHVEAHDEGYYGQNQTFKNEGEKREPVLAQNRQKV